MKTFGIMMDCSRNGVPKPYYVKEWMDRLQELGMNSLMLYTEDTYEVEGEPYFGYMRGRYSVAELKDMDDYAQTKGISLIPCIQTLAHLGSIFRWPGLRDLNDCDDIMICGLDATYDLIEKMFATIAKTFRSRVVHVGMDEAHMIGRGRYFDKFGVENHTEILLKHLEKVAEIGKKYGFTLLMWSDMFFRLTKDYGYLSDGDFKGIPDSVKARIPENVELVYWDYYFPTKAHYEHQYDVHDMVKKTRWFAGGLWTWNGFAPHIDKSMEVGRAAIATALERNIENVTLTLWGDHGAETSFLTILPGLWYDVCLAKGICDEKAIKEGFEKKYGLPFDDFLLLTFPGTPNSGTKDLVNADKYMLYNDPFLGLLDSEVTEGAAASYGACAEKMEKYLNHPRYGYLFRMQYYLGKVLARKFDLGYRIRKAYAAKDKETLTAIASEIGEIVTDLSRFYKAFEERWMKENKPFGFEVQDIRLGGLERRLKHCRERLSAYVKGEIARIEELETAQLPYFGPRDEHYENLYNRMVTACVLD